MNWNSSFIQPYSNSLEKGLFADAKDHARAITNFYINSVITGTIPGVPPSLPSPAAQGALVPVGPGIGVPVAVANSRRNVFYNTVLAYYQAKEISQGKANVQDIIVSAQRLIRKASIISRDIQNLITISTQLQKQIQEGDTKQISKDLLDVLVNDKYRIDREIKNKQQLLKDVIQPKIVEVTELGKIRLEDLLNQSKLLAQSGTITTALRKAKQYERMLDKKLIKRGKKLKKLAKIGLQVGKVLLQIASISASLVRDFENTKQEILRLQNDRRDINFNIAFESKQVSDDILGQSIELAQFLMSTLQGVVNDVNSVKTVFLRADKKYSVYVNELENLYYVEIPYLELLIENVDSDDVIKKPEAPKRTKDASLKDILTLIHKTIKKSEEADQKVKVKTTKTQSDMDESAKKLKEEIDQYVGELKQSNPKTSQQINRIKKKHGELVEQKNQFFEESKLLKEIRNASDIIGAGVEIAGNFAGGAYTISENQVPLNKMLRGYYNHLKVSNKRTSAQANEERKLKSEKIQEYAQYELLILMCIEMFKELKDGTFLSEFEESVKNIGSMSSTQAQQTVAAFKNLIENPPTINNLSSLEQLNLAILSNAEVVNLLYQLEQRHLRRVRQAAQLASESLSKQNTRLSVFVESFYKKVQKTPSFILMLLDYVKRGLKRVKEFLLELVQPIIKHIQKQVDIIKEKSKQKAADTANKKKEKLVNVDAKAMSLVFNIATRLFWTGLSWPNTAGTTFLVANIGPFRPIKALPVSGASGFAQELSNSFETQLTAGMTGQVIPNPATLIPPFPFIGYN